MILTRLILPTLIAMTILGSKGSAAWTLSKLGSCSTLTSNKQRPKTTQLQVNDNADDHNDDNVLLTIPIVTGVTLKMAFDQQWAVADVSHKKKSERFTSPGSLDLVHKLRATSDAVLVGRATVQRDDCTLTVRRVPLNKREQPVRVVIDTTLALLKDDDTNYKIFTDGLPLIIYHEDDKRMSGLSDDLVGLPRGPSGLLSTFSILQDLKSRSIHHVMVEGGPATAMSFLRDQSIDRAILIFAPLLFEEPYPSFINKTVLIQSGLEKLGTFECDGDQVECWSRPGLPWPTELLQDWP